MSSTQIIVSIIFTIGMGLIGVGVSKGLTEMGLAEEGSPGVECFGNIVLFIFYGIFGFVVANLVFSG